MKIIYTVFAVYLVLLSSGAAAEERKPQLLQNSEKCSITEQPCEIRDSTKSIIEYFYDQYIVKMISGGLDFLKSDPMPGAYPPPEGENN